jgi:hypothetical protein
VSGWAEPTWPNWTKSAYQARSGSSQDLDPTHSFSPLAFSSSTHARTGLPFDFPCAWCRRRPTCCPNRRGPAVPTAPNRRCTSLASSTESSPSPLSTLPQALTLANPIRIGSGYWCCSLQLPTVALDPTARHRESSAFFSFRSSASIFSTLASRCPWPLGDLVVRWCGAAVVTIARRWDGATVRTPASPGSPPSDAAAMVVLVWLLARCCCLLAW